MSSYDVSGSWSIHPPAEASSPSAIDPAQKPQVWPRVIGILSIIFGSLGVLMHGFQAIVLVIVASEHREMMVEFGVTATTASGDFPQWIMNLLTAIFAVMSISAALLVLWSILLVVAGVQLLKQRRAGVVLHVVWAIGKLLLSVMMLLPILILLSQVFSLIERLSDAGSGRSQPPWSLGLTIVQSLAGLAIAWSYPLFILTWLSFRKLK